MFDTESIKDIDKEKPRCPKDVLEYLNHLFDIDYLISEANNKQTIEFRYGYLIGVRDVLKTLQSLDNKESED